jgi:hypothetical protein
MNYIRLYNQIIDRAKDRIIEDLQYYENHHIIPRCMGGSNKKDNLVKLTAREHFICHWLLYKKYKTSKLAHAWFMMYMTSDNQSRYISKNYEQAKKAHSEAVSKQMKGEGNPFYGKTHTKETIDRIILANRNHKKTQDVIDNWVKKVAKKPKTIEHKSKIGRKGFVMLQNIHSKEIIRVPSVEIGIIYNTSDWVNPRKIKPETKYKCEYCDVITVKGNLARWHNDKCKRKNNAD